MERSEAEARYDAAIAEIRAHSEAADRRYVLEKLPKEFRRLLDPCVPTDLGKAYQFVEEFNEVLENYLNWWLE